MDNQHKKITGYRDLSEAEIAQMNEIKAMAVRVGELVERIQQGRYTLEGMRWAGIAKMDLQTGFMALTRSIALPETF